MSINGSPGFTFGEGGRITANPGYGNDVNAGFSPGQVGGMPPYVSKAVYQHQQWKQLDNGKLKRDFTRNPMTVWLMLLIPLTGIVLPAIIIFIPAMLWEFGAIFLQDPFNPANWVMIGAILVVAALLAWLLKALAWDLAVYAAVLHMRHKGMLTPFFREFAYLRDFDEHPERHPAFHAAYPLTEGGGR